MYNFSDKSLPSWSVFVTNASSNIAADTSEDEYSYECKQFCDIVSCFRETIFALDHFLGGTREYDAMLSFCF